MAVFLVLVLVQAPHLARLVLILTAGGSASGYLQARFHFCAGFGSRGVYNFGDVGTVQEIASPEDRARDRARAIQIGLGSLAIGIAVAVAAVSCPSEEPVSSRLNGVPAATGNRVAIGRRS